MSATCASCRFWSREDAEYGECRRRAPALVHGMLNGMSAFGSEHGLWPVTFIGAWCGEHSAKATDVPRNPDLARIRAEHAP